MDNTDTTTTEARILSAAQKVFYRDGFDGARMQAIAEIAGINKALLHYYFRSKQKLFEQVLYAKMKRFIPQITALFSSGDPLSVKLEALVDAYLRMLSENPQLPMFILFSIHRNPAFVDKLPGGPFAIVVKQIEHEIRIGKMRPVDPAHFMISLVSMCIFPFLGRHIASHMMGKDHDAYAMFLSERKEQIMHIVNAMMIS